MGVLNVVFTLLVGFIYSGVIVSGGCFWYYGWRDHNETLSRVGDAAVFIGLSIDFVLLNVRHYFNWVAWLETQLF